MNALVLLLALIGADPTYAEIRQQIDLLSSDEFEVRQVATDKLRQMGQPAIRVLLKLESKDREVQHRVGYIITTYIEEYNLNGKVLPWIDCLPEDYPDREKIIKECILHQHWRLDIPNFKAIYEPIDVEGNKSIKGQGDFNGYRWATKIYVLKLLKEGKKDSEIRDLLFKMKNIENRWVAQGGRYRQFDPFKPNPPTEE